MTMGSNLESLKTVWETWNIRWLVILSLSLQAFLILFAPLRKRSANACLIFLVWSAYLLADWVAAFAVGHISNSQSNDKSGGAANENLKAFWAPFLLVHLGGPDTITAFAFEDNTLWLRHMLNLILQVSAAIYVFYETFPDNKLLIPTVLMFVAGVVKYGERTRALYLGSFRRFKKSMLSDFLHAYVGDSYPTSATHNFFREMIGKVELCKAEDGKLDEVSVVYWGYFFFDFFKGLIVDLIFTFSERQLSQEFFYNRTAEDAFKVIQVELNFFFEVLYTKGLVVHSKLGFVFRFLASGTVIVALVLFTRLKKHGFHRFDVRLTYCLLYGATALDAIALFMLIFSDWTVSTVKNSHILNKLFKKKYLSFITRMNRPRTCQIKFEDNFEVLDPSQIKPEDNFEVWDSPILSRRWSETIYSYNFLSVCLGVRPRKIQKPKRCCGATFGKIFGFLSYTSEQQVLCLGLQRTTNWFSRALTSAAKWVGLEDALDSLKYVSRNPFPTKLWEFIFVELRDKSRFTGDADMARKIYEARGNWVLQDRKWKSDCQAIMNYVKDAEYDKSLLLWHIATELCYNTDNSPNNPNLDREFSKILSDYMLYLLIKQPTMMSNVAGIGQIRLRDTCTEAKHLFRKREIKEVKDACQKILETEGKNIREIKDWEKSVLFDGRNLAKMLKDQGPKKWNIMCRVWVELLSYAASHCRAETHARVLSEGGALVTFVWLLMAHLGLGERY